MDANAIIRLNKYVCWWAGLRGGRSVLAESIESEQFQPMWVGVATEQLGRTFSDSLRSITACTDFVSQINGSSLYLAGQSQFLAQP